MNPMKLWDALQGQKRKIGGVIGGVVLVGQIVQMRWNLHFPWLDNGLLTAQDIGNAFGLIGTAVALGGKSAPPAPPA